MARRKVAHPRKKQDTVSGGPFGKREILLVAGAAVIVVALVIFFGSGLFRSSTPAPTPASVTVRVDSGDSTMGSADAPVTVMEFSDYQCPYCAKFARGEGKQLEETYVKEGKVRFIYKDFIIIGQESTWAAEAARCAGDQGRFWDYHDKLFDSQQGENKGFFSKPNLKKFAAELGLDTAQFNQCLDSDKYQNAVQRDTAEGKRLGVRGTPTIFVNGQMITGATFEQLRAAIEAQLSAGS